MCSQALLWKRTGPFLLTNAGCRRCHFQSISSVCLEKAMATHSSTPAWKIPWMEEPGRLQSMGSLGVGHNWVTLLSLFTFMHWRRKWQPTPVFLPGESQGRQSIVGCCLWGHKESGLSSINLLSVLLRHNGFARIQKAVVDQTSSRPPNSDHDLFLVQVWLWEVLWSFFSVQPLSWSSLVI